MKALCISVVVPVYNIEKWLPACLDSLLKQTYENFQLILVNDGSNDNSKNICDEYAKRDSRIEVVHQKNGGLSKARNTGIEFAKGEYLCFVDGDDFCDKDMLKIAMENFSEDIDIVAFGFYKNSKKNTAKKNKISRSFNEALNLYVAGELNVSAWGKVYKKKIFDNIRFPEGKLFEDMWIFPKIAENRILILNKALYHYVIRENSITTAKFSPQSMDFLDSLSVWDGNKKLLKMVRLRIAWNLLLFMENEYDKNENKIYAEQLARILRTEKSFFVPIRGFINFILANLLSFGFSYSVVLNFRLFLRRLCL
jgi:glycosyltransferase involved in cell wall biosynthesis